MFMWACLYGYFAFDEIPSELTIFGAMMIAGCGILSWHFEQKESKKR